MKSHILNTITPGNPPAYLANGLIGLRVFPIPFLGGSALVNGFNGLSPEKLTDEYADAPYPLGADIQLEGVWLSRRPDLARFEQQEYAFSCGELTSRFHFTVSGKTAQVEVLTFCSRTQPTLALQEVAITVNKPTRLVLQSHIGRQGLTGELKYRLMPQDRWDAMIQWESRAGLSTVGVAYISEFQGTDLEKRSRNNYGSEQEIELTQYAIAARPGKRYVMRQLASLVPSLMHSEPHWEASRLLFAGNWIGFDKLRDANRAAWAELWKGRVRIHGAEEHWQDMADAAFFYLHSSVSPSSPCSVAPFGLSRRVEYSGHVFWDTETFIFPAVLLSSPHAARAMLDYRSRCLPAAKFNAQLNGYRGVQFPWQSANTGCEVTPYWAAGGILEHHVNMDVAFAMIQYVHATGDDLFFRQQAWPVIESVAHWIVSRVTKTSRGYEILHVTGIDETIDNIHNNAETNITAIVVLREAIALARRSGLKPPAAWGDVAKRMYIPIDPKTHVILKHDGYEYKEGMCVPGPLAAYFPFGWSHSPTVDRATIKYYMDLAPTYFGMPMLSALLGVFAARSGDRKLALRSFEEGSRSFIQEPFMQFNEVSQKLHSSFSGWGTTVFLTNPAGFLMALQYGLTGLHLGSGAPKSWLQRRIVMPHGWDGIEMDRIWVRGQPMRLQARHGAARATLESC
ncbi:MAG: glycoside hydrolase family 65 protein [Phycisphaeraceae bacterium]|nr:glycoside hydrolase family 65 protein [Phycisphaeraceae bacterium]